MAFYWTPWALPALFVLVVCGGMALFVFLARPDRSQNRRLALQLGLEGIVVALVSGATWVIDDPATAWALSATAYFLVWPKLWAYYSFLGTLSTPLARPLRSRWVLGGFLALTLLAACSVLVRPELYQGAPVPGRPLAAWLSPPGTMFWPIMNMWGVMWLVGLTFSISALRNAQTPIARRQAKAYLLSFGFRDVTFGLLTIVLPLIPPTHPAWLWVFLVFPIIWIVYPLLVGYAILKTQLFDIDLKLKWTIRRGTLVGFFVAAFVVVTAIVEQWLQQYGVVVGGAAVGLMLLAVRPLERVADRVANSAMPSVRDDAEYRTVRKREVYRATVEAAMADGTVTERERDMLAKLADQLGLSAGEARAIEVAARATA